MKEQIDTVLNHKNWTGLTLLELMEAGRVSRDSKELTSFIKSALGEPRNLNELNNQIKIAQEIQSIEFA